MKHYVPDYISFDLSTGTVIKLMEQYHDVRFENTTFYIAPEYIIYARDTYLKLTKDQRIKVFDYFARQFVVKDVNINPYNIIESGPPSTQLDYYIYVVLVTIFRQLEWEKASEIVNINFYLELWQNLSSIIMGIYSGTIRGGYRRKLKQTRKNKRGAKKTRKRSM
jgi:hypothetical protein